jgi:hypothetical protein
MNRKPDLGVGKQTDPVYENLKVEPEKPEETGQTDQVRPATNVSFMQSP